MPSGHCFCSLKSQPGSIQNLPLECWFNNLKTPGKKFILVKFQTCIKNWPFQVVLSNNFFYSIFRTPFHGCLWLFTPVLQFLFLICCNSLITKTEDLTTHNIHNFHWNFWWENFSCGRSNDRKSCLSYMQPDFWICH